MEQRNSKKTRPHGESTPDARTSKLSGGPLKATRSGRRSSLGDRNRSASLIVKGRKEYVEVGASGDSSRTEDQDVKLSGKSQASVLGEGHPQSGHVSQRSQDLRSCQLPRNVSAGLFRCNEALPESLSPSDILLMMPWDIMAELQCYRVTSTHRW